MNPNSRRRWLPALLGLLAACAESEHIAAPAKPCDNFSTTLAIKDRMAQPASDFIAGEDITFEALVTNTSSSPQTLTVSNGCPQLNFFVSNSAGQEVWGSLDGIACTQALREEPYAAGETKSFSATWNQRGRDGIQVSAGAYSVNAHNAVLECGAALDRWANFNIQ